MTQTSAEQAQALKEIDDLCYAYKKGEISKLSNDNKLSNTFKLDKNPHDRIINEIYAIAKQTRGRVDAEGEFDE